MFSSQFNERINDWLYAGSNWQAVASDVQDLRAEMLKQSEALQDNQADLMFSQSETNRKLEQVIEKTTSLEDIIMSLADKIKELVAVETAEGKKLQEQNSALQSSLITTTEKIAALEGTIARLEALPSSVPGLESEIASLKTNLAEAKQQIEDASAAADAIAEINPTPVSDGVVEEVKENPEIETPPVVDEAPTPTPDTIPAPEVVDAAVDAINSADDGDKPATPSTGEGGDDTLADRVFS